MLVVKERFRSGRFDGNLAQGNRYGALVVYFRGAGATGTTEP